MKLKNFLFKLTKNNIIYILFLIVITIIIYKYNSYEHFSTTAICRTSNVPCNEKEYDIIVCLGQSNMAGSSISDNNISSTYINDNDYRNDLHYDIDPKVDKATFNIYAPNNVTICQSQETSTNFSMATSLGREYAKRTNKNVLIINVALRSTGILRRFSGNSDYLWQLSDTSDGRALYPLAKQFILNVKNKICNRSKVVAICYQGSEEDSYLDNCSSSYNRTYIDNYNTKMSELLNTLKRDIGNTNTKVMIGGLLLGDNTGHHCSDYFTNNVLKEVARRNNYIFVSTDSNNRSSIKYLQRRLNGPGGVHFNKLSHIELGKRYSYYYFN